MDAAEAEYMRLCQCMVDAQITARDITSPRVIEVLRRTPRHRFVSNEQLKSAYDDRPLPIGAGQTISQPYMVALMTQWLSLAPTDHVLEIGTGSGYQTAILAQLAQTVISIERHASLADTARKRLAAMGFDNVTILHDDGTLGCPTHAPYDAILVTAAAPAVPPALQTQLADSGRLVCPVGGHDVQTLIRITRTGNTYRQEQSIDCVFVPLIGKQGWDL